MIEQEPIQIVEETTKLERGISPYLDSILGTEFKILNDIGFIRVIDYMGVDASIVQAARVSYGVGTKKVREDKGLINYLMKNDHSSPFEMCELKIHAKMPLFVARQWIRHRTASVNEYSARYSEMKDEFYIPNELFSQSETNRQTSGNVVLDNSDELKELMVDNSKRAFEDYKKLLDSGVSRETARCVLPVNVYTEWYWKCDLRNLLHFIRLRDDAHAQHEIREYARVLSSIVKQWVPYTWEAFEKHRITITTLSHGMIDVIKRRLNGEEVNRNSSQLTLPEWNELNLLFPEKKEDGV